MPFYGYQNFPMPEFLCSYTWQAYMVLAVDTKSECVIAWKVMMTVEATGKEVGADVKHYI